MWRMTGIHTSQPSRFPTIYIKLVYLCCQKWQCLNIFKIVSSCIKNIDALPFQADFQNMKLKVKIILCQNWKMQNWFGFLRFFFFFKEKQTNKLIHLDVLPRIHQMYLCTLQRGVRPPHTHTHKCLGYDTKMHSVMNLQFWSSGKYGVTFIDITFKPKLSQSGCTYGLI